MKRIKSLFVSLRYALCGLREALKGNTFQVFLVIALIVAVFVFWLDIPILEKVVLILTTGFVLGLELINSQIEKIVDVFCPEQHKEVKKIKDISAAAVLIACITALIVAILILLT